MDAGKILDELPQQRGSAENFQTRHKALSADRLIHDEL